MGQMFFNFSEKYNFLYRLHGVVMHSFYIAPNLPRALLKGAVSS